MITQHWYVVYTKPKCELKVSNLLARKQIESYCPLHIPETGRADRKKPGMVPLFASFVFVYIEESQIADTLLTPGVVNFLYWLNKPVTVDESEIASLVRLSKQYHHLELQRYFIRETPQKSNAAAPAVALEEPVPPGKEKIVLPSLGYCVIATP